MRSQLRPWAEVLVSRGTAAGALAKSALGREEFFSWGWELLDALGKRYLMALLRGLGPGLALLRVR